MKNKIYYSKQYDMHVREVNQNSIHYCTDCVFFNDVWCDCDLETDDRLHEICLNNTCTYDRHNTKFIQIKL